VKLKIHLFSIYILRVPMAVSIQITELNLCITNGELAVLPNLRLPELPAIQRACGRRVCNSRFVHVVHEIYFLKESVIRLLMVLSRFYRVAF
jgi:hypothetical protein